MNMDCFGEIGSLILLALYRMIIENLVCDESNVDSGQNYKYLYYIQWRV